MPFTRVIRRRNVYRRRTVRRAAPRSVRRRFPARRVRRPIRRSRFSRRRGRKALSFTNKNAAFAQLKTVLRGPQVYITAPIGNDIIFNMFPDWTTMNMWPTAAGVMGHNMYATLFDSVHLDKIVIHIRPTEPGNAQTGSAYPENWHQELWHCFDNDADGRRFASRTDFELDPGTKKSTYTGLLRVPKSIVMYPKWQYQTGFAPGGSVSAQSSACPGVNPWWDLGIFTADPAHYPVMSRATQQIAIVSRSGMSWTYSYDMHVSYRGLRQGNHYASITRVSDPINTEDNNTETSPVVAN